MTEYVCEITQDYPGIPYEHEDFSGTMERREEIVRCRDCRRSFEERGELWCRGIVGPPIEPDGFCAWGEPREEG